MRGMTGGWRLLANLALMVGVLAVAAFGVSQVATRQWRVQKTFNVSADFATVGGVGEGATVRVQGIDAGVVDAVVPLARPGDQVRLRLRVDESLRHLVRVDAVARIVTEGVVGAKVVEIVPGQPDAPPLGTSAVLATERPAELADLIKKATASLERVDAATVAAEKGLGEINAIAATIRRGEGSLGKLVADDEAYRSLMSLSKRGGRAFDEMDENLAALKRTWPLSRYFNDRAFFDRERVLFHPGAERDSRTVAGDDLFEPGRSVLTPTGRRRLDEVGAWFKKVKRPTSEVVIAAFTDQPRDADLAQILTQEQADAVRKYLAEHHALNSVTWLSNRKVAAVGFGNEAPRTCRSGCGTLANKTGGNHPVHASGVMAGLERASAQSRARRLSWLSNLPVGSAQGAILHCREESGAPGCVRDFGSKAADRVPRSSL